MAQTHPTRAEANEKLVRLAELIDVDPFGNITLTAHGSQIVFRTNGDIQLHAARDLDQKSGRWAHTNSDVTEISRELGRVLYGPRGEILRAW